MNNARTRALVQKAIQAGILAFLLELSSLAFHWPWLVFVSLGLAVYGLGCLGYAVFWWWLSRR
ncbi:hypothetical protein [Lacticaseibacillus parakribbianus]|uniref:hypothetical protein n=1 Tax=Lacticaseibacillus parakribbianus TaxID=2970927 RepID=UPI0021CB1301|nr:hypothetical protein [Lacticaseibacillus parakribbianus]